MQRGSVSVSAQGCRTCPARAASGEEEAALSSLCTVRPIRLADEDAVARAAYATEVFGISAERPFPARRLFEQW